MSKPIVKKNSLSASERLSSRKALDSLFTEGRALVASPFRLLYLETTYDEQFPVKIAFSAPKRRMKLAHDRNRAKRLMREVYRLNKHALLHFCQEEKRGLDIMLISQSNTPPKYNVTEEKIILLLKRLIAKNENAAQ